MIGTKALPVDRAEGGRLKRICRACDVVFETPPRLVALVRGLQFVLRGEPSEQVRRDAAVLHDVQIAAFLYQRHGPPMGMQAAPLDDRMFFRPRSEDHLAMQELLNVVYCLLAGHPEIELPAEHKERLLAVQRLVAGDVSVPADAVNADSAEIMEASPCGA